MYQTSRAPRASPSPHHAAAARARSARMRRARRDERDEYSDDHSSDDYSAAARSHASSRSRSVASTSQRFSESSREESFTSSDEDDGPGYQRNARDPPIASRARERVSVTSDDLRGESAWETLSRTAREMAQGKETIAARRRRFCAVVSKRGKDPRGAYEIARCPGAVSALKRLMRDADVDVRRAACEAASALAKTELGAGCLCASDAELKDAWEIIRLWEWKLALARIRQTFGFRAYLKSYASFTASTSLPLKVSGGAADKYLSTQLFFPLQSHVSPTFKSETSISESLEAVLSRPREESEVLMSALRAVDALILTLSSASEGVPLVHSVMTAVAVRLKRTTRSGLAALDPVEVFTSSDWTAAIRPRSYFRRVLNFLGVDKRRRNAKSDVSQDEEDDEDEDEDEEDDEKAANKRMLKRSLVHAKLSVTDRRLYQHLLVLSTSETDANIRENANRILYEATLRCDNNSIGKKVYQSLVSNDNQLRASALSWIAYLFVQHTRTIRSFVSLSAQDPWPLTKTTKFLLSDEVLRSAASGLSEKSEFTRLNATRMLRAAWDAISARPTAATSAKSQEPKLEKAEEHEVFVVDERLTFMDTERWFIFVNNGVISALCDMQLSQAPGASQLAGTVLEHFHKTEPAAMRFLLARGTEPSVSEKRETMRLKIDQRKSSFKKSVVVTAKDRSDEESKEPPKEEEVEVLAVPTHYARWREHKSKHKPLMASFKKLEGLETEALDRSGWRARTEDYILAGGSSRIKNGAESQRGPYERAYLREGRGLGIAGRVDKAPPVFTESTAVGLYNAESARIPKRSSARAFTRPSKRHDIRGL